MDIIGQVEVLEREATPRPFLAGYDGPSRPIITTGDRSVMLALGRLEGGTARAYAKEDADAQVLSIARNSLPEVIALAKAVVKHTDGHGFHNGRGTLSNCRHGDDCPILTALDALLRVWGENVEGAKA